MAQLHTITRTVAGASLALPDLPVHSIIVRRGDFSRFDFMHQAFGHQIDVIWDRRRGDRRRVNILFDAQDRRRRDRRGSTPPSWTALSFVVVNGQR